MSPDEGFVEALTERCVNVVNALKNRMDKFASPDLVNSNAVVLGGLNRNPRQFMAEHGSFPDVYPLPAPQLALAEDRNPPSAEIPDGVSPAGFDADDVHLNVRPRVSAT